MIEEIGETIVKFFDEDPGNITTNYYWYYDGKFTKFSSTKSDDGFKVLNYPTELESLIRTLFS